VVGGGVLQRRQLRRSRGRRFCRRPSRGRLPSSPRLLRQPAEVVARSAGAARRRYCALKGLDHLAALDVGVEAVFEGTAPGYKLEKTAHVD
jgi:hypothetical protein